MAPGANADTVSSHLDHIGELTRANGHEEDVRNFNDTFRSSLAHLDDGRWVGGVLEGAACTRNDRPGLADNLRPRGNR